MNRKQSISSSLSEFAKKGKVEVEGREDEKKMKTIECYLNVIQLINLRFKLLHSISESELLFNIYK
jgi:hypothetical protein